MTGSDLEVLNLGIFDIRICFGFRYSKFGFIDSVFKVHKTLALVFK